MQGRKEMLYICKKRGHLGKDCEENRYFKKKGNKEEGNKEKVFIVWEKKI